ncbi:DUF2089 domain-containing protein [Tessaracoccus antarcticus]|uniref:DUF2089 domain-containing protein n=1 Tax=Tessaracoccus antarcticus TaxID=2479848 RepID=A0A3M0GB62_9ACTN|nr:DUF2089 domain-containing protein [Tessaracoccus antarcticus]RMB62201.1 DUF2089 domain-containing protein [Tessaracoccus antarcticus]
MTHHLYHAPADCPVCGDDLIVTRKGCRTCGTELAGEFTSCAYCGLETSELDLLRVFLTSRGNLREVEKHLQVSYPTARARLDAVIDKLGFTPTGDAADSQSDPSDPVTGEPAEEPMSPQEQVLARVAAGEISADIAATLLASL